MFEKVVLINLKRRQDRLASVQKEMTDKGWPFKKPEIFEAIDGKIVPTPPGWKQGRGAWGCMQSHRHILEKAIIDNISSILILEDDLCMRTNFIEEAETFMKNVPDDWQQLMLGGQHMSSTVKIKPGIVKCSNCQRTHAYAIRGKFMRDLYAQWCSPTSDVHCDWIMGAMHNKYQVYAPDPFLFGQTRSHSDICERINPTKFWSPPDGKELIIVLKTSKEVVSKLRLHGIHTGYDRDKISDIDKGLIAVFNSKNIQQKLTKWITDLQWEVVSEEGFILAVWHPKATTELVRKCWNGPVLEIKADTLEEALHKLPSKSKHNCIVLLHSDKNTVAKLRRLGWHTGNWRDSITDIDNGLREWAVDKNKDKLNKIINVLGQEVQKMRNGVVCLWHPELKLEHISSNLQVVEITAVTAEEAIQKWQAAIGK